MISSIQLLGLLGVIFGYSLVLLENANAEVGLGSPQVPSLLSIMAEQKSQTPEATSPTSTTTTLSWAQKAAAGNGNAQSFQKSTPVSSTAATWASMAGGMRNSATPANRPSLSVNIPSRKLSATQVLTPGSPEQCGNVYKFDFLKLSLSWSPGYCQTSDRPCIAERRNGFNIHGMWPDTYIRENTDLDPRFCCFEKRLNRDQINSNLWKSFENAWRSVHHTDSNYGNWKLIEHEWIKHGTCARDVPKLHGPERYFTNTLRLFRDLDLVSRLRAHNLTPNNQKPVRGSEVLQVLQNITGGKKAMIKCKRDRAGKTILTEFNFCYDHNLEYINCPNTFHSCLGNLLFVE